MRKSLFLAAAVAAFGVSNAHAQSDVTTGTGTADTPVAPSPPGTSPDVGTTPDVTVPVPVQPATPDTTSGDTTTSSGTTAVEPVAVPVVPVPVQNQPNQDTEAGRYRPFARLGAAILIGGGYEDFTNSGLRAATSGGGFWTARLVAGTHQFIGLEAAYVGAARTVNTLGLSSDARLISNGAEGAVRVNIPIVRGPSLIEPFGFVGLGWQHYSLTNTNTNTSDIARKDDIMTVPYGGGLEFAYGSFIADVRYTYRQTYYNDLLRSTGGKLNNWGVGGQMGVEF